MANQNNFQTNIEQASLGYKKFSVSRVVDLTQDNLVETEIPAYFPSDLIGANIEMALYSLADNSLIFSENINNETTDPAITTKTIQYNDGGLRNVVVIDFSKLRSVTFPIGTFSMTLSFFANEIGAYDNQILRITTISPSRTEVELELLDGSKKQNMIQFATPKISVKWIDEIVRQIFNQPMTGLETPPVISSSINQIYISEALGPVSSQQLTTYGFDVDKNQQPGIYTIAQTVLDLAYPIAQKKVMEYVSSGSKTLDKTQLTTIVEQAMDDAYDVVYNDTLTNPFKYRFDLI